MAEFGINYPLECLQVYATPLISLLFTWSLLPIKLQNFPHALKFLPTSWLTDAFSQAHNSTMDRLWAWFFYYLMSFCSKMCLFATQSGYSACIMVQPLCPIPFSNSNNCEVDALQHMQHVCRWPGVGFLKNNSKIECTFWTRTYLRKWKLKKKLGHDTPYRYDSSDLNTH